MERKNNKPANNKAANKRANNNKTNKKRNRNSNNMNNNNSRNNNRRNNRPTKRTRAKAFGFATTKPNVRIQEPENNNSRREPIGPGHRTRTRRLLGQAPAPRFNAPLQKALATLSAVAHSEGQNLEEMMEYVDENNAIPPKVKEMVKKNLTLKYPMLSSSGQSTNWKNNS